MKHVDLFNEFLKETVNLNDTRVADLEMSIEAIKDAVRASDWEPHLNSWMAHGSWAHKTIIRPVDGGEFDADLIVFVEHVQGWTAATYIDELYNAFHENATYKDKVNRSSHCVTISYTNDKKIVACHGNSSSILCRPRCLLIAVMATRSISSALNSSANRRAEHTWLVDPLPSRIVIAPRPRPCCGTSRPPEWIRRITICSLAGAMAAIRGAISRRAATSPSMRRSRGSFRTRSFPARRDRHRGANPRRPYGRWFRRVPRAGPVPTNAA